MTLNTAYRQRHPSGIYYFRIAIPQGLKSLLRQRELKQSLRTRDPVIAQRTAQVLALEAEHLFNRIELILPAYSGHVVKRLVVPQTLSG